MKTVRINHFVARYFFLWICLYSSAVFSQSQKSIQGKLTDELNVAISGASVLLKNSTGEIVTYTISDGNGSFALATELFGEHTLEVSHISFALYIQTIELRESEDKYSLHIQLQPKNNTLNEITIQARKPAVRQQGDTLSYNLDAFTTGSEQKLKDIIEKLPGLEIDDSGKIKSEGKIIDNLLVDGKPFFGNNHKIATDNLNAKMVKGIDYLKNYETFDAVKEIEGSNETALNIQIKEEYQGRPTGDIEAYGAYKDRYRLHTNLFSFAKTHNLSFIGDVNNTGKQPISLLDFIQMDKSRNIKNKDDALSSVGSDSTLPNFLIDNENRTEQQSRFGALNTVFSPLKNVAIEAFSLLNMERIKSKQFSDREYFSPTETLFSEEDIREKADFLLNQTNINAEYKPGKNSLLSYALDYKPQKNDFYTAIDGKVEATEQSTTQKIKTRGHTLGQNLGYTIRLANNKLLSLNAYSNTIQNNTQLGLMSDQSLFDRGNAISQETRSRTAEYGLYSTYTQRTKNHIVKFNLGHVWENNKFYAPNLPDKISLYDQNYLYTGTSIEKKEGFFQYKALVNLRNYTLPYNDTKDHSWQFLPALEGKMQFSKTHYVSFKYIRQAGLPQADQLNSFPYVIDYRNFQDNSKVDYRKPILNNHFEFQYYYLDLFSGTQILLNSFYNKRRNDIGVNNEISGSYNYSYALNTPYKSNWMNRLRFQTRINPIKTTFKLDVDYSHIVSNNYVNADKNKATTQQYRIKPFLASYIKDSWINYEIGVELEQNSTSFSLTTLKNKGRKTSPSINVKGEFSKNWSYFINNALSYYSTSAAKRKLYQLDFELRYHKEGSKFSYWVSGENILNIKNTQVVEAIAKQNSLSRNILYRMPGYIGAGMSFDF